MALPVILVDSAGSDTLASGAGPSTALTGTNASTNAAGTLVTLDGSPSLTNVAVDGSHVIYLADTTAGNRNFGKITAKDDVGKTVTVANAFGISLSGKSWAIGGKRATLASTTSKKLFDNNSAAGDAMPGWIVEMQSGYTETIAAELAFRRAGNTTDGPITLRGASGAATRPILTFSNNGAALGNRTAAEYIYFKDFELQNSNATKTASVAMGSGNASVFHARNVKVSHSTNKFWKATDGTSVALLEDCEIGFCASDGLTGNASGMSVRNCWVHDCGGHGIILNDSGGNRSEVIGCLVTANTSDGIRVTSTGATLRLSSPIIIGNTVNANGSDGLEMNTAITQLGTYLNMPIINNIFSNNGGYGINLSAASLVQAVLDLFSAVLRNNTLYNNTSGTLNPSTLTNENGQTSNPVYTNSGGNDYSIGTAVKATGYPLGGTLPIGTTSSTYSYVDPGAAQRQEAGGAATFGWVVGG